MSMPKFDISGGVALSNLEQKLTMGAALIRCSLAGHCLIRINPSEREHHLQINAPVRRLRIEYASSQRGGLAEKAGAEIADRRSRVDVVKNVARVGAEGKAITLIRPLGAAHRASTRTAHPNWPTTPGASSSLDMSMVSLSLRGGI